MRDMIKGINEFYNKSVYVWRATKKPTKRDLKESLKIVLIGIFILGLIGFLVSIIFGLLHV